MIRSHLQLHDFIEPVKPREAATVLLLRDVEGQLERFVLLVDDRVASTLDQNLWVDEPGQRRDLAAAR